MTAVLIGAVMVVAGCSSGSTNRTDGSARPAASTASSAPSESASAAGPLDTGTYATTARAPFGTANGDELPELESQRLAEFVTLPQEIDNRFTQAALPFGAVVNTAAATDLLGGADAAAAAIGNKLIAGFYGSASAPKDKADQSVASITHGVIRFKTPADADRAGQAIYTAMLAARTDRFDNPQPAPQKVAIPTLAGSLVLRYSNPRLPGYTALTVHKSYLVVDQFVEPPTENNAARALRRSLDLQIPLLDRFPATATGSGANIVKDQNKVLIYALSNPNPRTALNDGVFGPRGFAFASDKPLEVVQQLQDAGAEHTAVAGTIVFRAATAQKAQKLFSQRVAFFATDPAASPQGLPSAKCISDGATKNICWIVNGRYIGEAQNQDLKAAQQAISAQYKVLLTADQNAN
ncbi:hypothetical protein ASG12_07535 [Williamsia sp. Leaf354]|uniref:DUF7373 family lipoprotein n=1 Tax=Williamsia sp. Leaf354 TaxID=1736349 RepID=UPI0006F7C102|nr:hypothetical protein [Williamsia sp. Leaf354]KQS00707.1 hypothetical protein ASG12_07535 [Williamsia sp. Leaf354]